MLRQSRHSKKTWLILNWSGWGYDRKEAAVKSSIINLTSQSMHVCVCMYVNMYVCMYECVFVCVCISACVCKCGAVCCAMLCCVKWWRTWRITFCLTRASTRFSCFSVTMKLNTFSSSSSVLKPDNWDNRSKGRKEGMMCWMGMVRSEKEGMLGIVGGWEGIWREVVC